MKAWPKDSRWGLLFTHFAGDYLQTLLSRYKLGVKHLADPAPEAAALQHMAAAALRARPWRSGAISAGGGARQARARLADLFAAHALARGKDAEGIAMERERALRAPLTVAVVARIDPGPPGGARARAVDGCGWRGGERP